MSRSRPPPVDDADFEAIEAAVMETRRGRWFLAEYARRNRHADTDMLLAALARFDNVVRNDGAGALADMRTSVAASAEALARAKADIRLLAPAAEILQDAAERLQEIAWGLRERALDPYCDELEGVIAALHGVCAAHDRLAATLRAAVRTLDDLHDRIDDLIDGPRASEQGQGAAAAPEPQPEIASPSLQPLAGEPAAPISAQPIVADPLAPLARLSAAERIALFT